MRHKVLRASLLFSIFVFPFLTSCKPSKKVELAYSFFVAGHTYGQPRVNSVGFHPPFRAAFETINQQAKLQFGVLTGDIVTSATPQDWDEIDADLKALRVPVHFAPGNHDLTDRKLYESRYGPTFFEFEQNGDLMIVLDPNLSAWNIMGEQLEFLRKSLKSGEHANIFIFCHQVIWWEPQNKFAYMQPNSTKGRAETVNFWSEVEPLLAASNSNIYLFAGDVGAFPNGAEVGYGEHKNMTFVTSGMGGGQRDNFLVVKVLADHGVEIQLISLNGNELGPLEQQKVSNP